MGRPRKYRYITINPYSDNPIGPSVVKFKLSTIPPAHSSSLLPPLKTTRCPTTSIRVEVDQGKSKKELKQQCKDLGLKQSGNKRELNERLRQHDIAMEKKEQQKLARVRGRRARVIHVYGTCPHVIIRRPRLRLGL